MNQRSFLKYTTFILKKQSLNAPDFALYCRHIIYKIRNITEQGKKKLSSVNLIIIYFFKPKGNINTHYPALLVSLYGPHFHLVGKGDR